MNEKMCPSSNRHFVWFIRFRTDMSIRGDTSWVIYTPVFPIFKYTKYSPHFTAYHSFLCNCSASCVRRGPPIRTTSEERDPFYPGRRLSIILGTSSGAKFVLRTQRYRWARNCFLIIVYTAGLFSSNILCF